MPTRSSGPLLGGQTSFLLFITFFTFGMAAILVKVPPEMGGALVVGIIVFISTFMSAEAGLYLLIISMLLSPEFGAGGLGDGSDTTSSRGVTLRAEDILLVLLGFAWLARTAVNKGLGLIRPTPLNAPIGSYVAICMLATLAGFIAGHVRGITGFFYVLKYVEYFIVYFLICNNLQSRRQIEKFLAVMLVTAFIVCLTAIAQIPSGARVSAPFEGERGEPNTLGGYLILVGSVTACLALHLKNKKLTRYLWALLGLMIIPFFATLSRGSYLALPFVYGAVAYFRPGKRVQMVAVLVVVSAIGIIFMPKSVVERVTYTFNQGYTQQEKKKIGNVELDTSTTERLNSWENALTDGMKSPLWGYGVTGYGFLDAQYPRIWVETGLLGLFFFFSLMYKVVKESLKLYEETEIPLYRGLSMGLICGLVGLMIHGLGANTFTIVRVMEPFWLIAGLVVSAYKLEMAERAEVASTAKAAIEAGGQGLETKSTEKA
jgi:hypothetical protein